MLRVKQKGLKIQPIINLPLVLEDNSTVVKQTPVPMGEESPETQRRIPFEINTFT
jgi:hypothetical protein